MVKFQSTPDLINRENPIVKDTVIITDAFQSTPDLINRENHRNNRYTP